MVGYYANRILHTIHLQLFLYGVQTGFVYRYISMLVSDSVER